MTTRLLILFAAALLCWASPAEAQTIKSLGYNTTNGQVVYTGTNTLTFTNSQIGILESGEDVVFLRNQSGALAFYSEATTLATFTTAEINFFYPVVFNNTTNAAVTRANLGLGSGLITNVVAGTNTLVFSNGILTGVNP